MGKITGKFQITLPKRLVAAYGLKVGDEVELSPAGDAITLLPAGRTKAASTLDERLRYFDRATDRQRKRQRSGGAGSTTERGWTREGLYTRGRSR